MSKLISKWGIEILNCIASPIPTMKMRCKKYNNYGYLFCRMPSKGDGSLLWTRSTLPLSLFSLADLKLRWKGSSNTFAASYLVQKKSSIGPMGGWVVVYLHMWLTLLCNIPPWRFGRWSHIHRSNHTHIGAFSRFSLLVFYMYYTTIHFSGILPLIFFFEAISSS